MSTLEHQRRHLAGLPNLDTPTLDLDAAKKAAIAIVERWPNPELGPAGLDAFVDTIAHLGLTREQLLTAFRRLSIEHPDNFRPVPLDFIRAARPRTRPELNDWHPTDAGTTPADHIPPDQFRQLLTQARHQLTKEPTP
jgi:hypothetical protein